MTQSGSKDLRSRGTDGVIPNLRPGEDIISAQQTGRESEFSFPLSFSIQVLSRSADAHPHWGGPSSLLSTPTQVLISSTNMLTYTPRITMNQISGYPMVQSNCHVELTITEALWDRAELRSEKVLLVWCVTWCWCPWGVLLLQLLRRALLPQR